jgi:hypothetical protein
VKDLILEFLLVKPTMEIGINIVDVVKYISFMMVCSVLVAVWHYECRLANEIRQLQLRKEEQDRIIRIIKGTKK